MLKWGTLHHNCVHIHSPVFLRNFSTDLWDSRVFAAVLVSHVPSKKAALDRIKMIVQGPPEDEYKQRLLNGKLLLKTLQDLQIPFLPPPEAMAEGNSRVLMMLTLTLMDVCPQLVPRATIEFQGRLNGDVVRLIELNNPIGRSVTYLVRLEGSDEYTCAQQYIVLAPKSSAPIAITHKAKFSLPTSCTLFLVASEAQDRISPLVFKLTSTVVTNQASSVVIPHAAQLYEMSTIEVPVSHPFDVDMCNFHITLIERVPNEYPGSRGKNAARPGGGVGGGGWGGGG